VFVKALNEGDTLCYQIMEEIVSHLSTSITNFIHLLNPEVIILSGRGSAAGKIWFAPIQQALNKHCIPRIAANTVIELSDLGHRAELIGSAVLVMENFEMPRIRNEVVSVTH